MGFIGGSICLTLLAFLLLSIGGGIPYQNRIGVVGTSSIGAAAAAVDWGYWHVCAQGSLNVYVGDGAFFRTNADCIDSEDVFCLSDDQLGTSAPQVDGTTTSFSYSSSNCQSLKAVRAFWMISLIGVAGVFVLLVLASCFSDRLGLVAGIVSALTFVCIVVTWGVWLSMELPNVGANNVDTSHTKNLYAGFGMMVSSNILMLFVTIMTFVAATSGSKE